MPTEEASGANFNTLTNDIEDLKADLDQFPMLLGYEKINSNEYPAIAAYNYAGSGTLTGDNQLFIPSGANVLNSRLGKTFLFNKEYFIGKIFILTLHYTISGDISRFTFVTTKQDPNDAEITVLNNDINNPMILLDFTNATFANIRYKYIYGLLQGTGSYTVSENTTITFTGYELKIYKNNDIDDLKSSTSEIEQDIDDLKSSVSEIKEICGSEAINITNLFEIVNGQLNGATWNNPSLTIPSGSTGNNSSCGYRIIGENFDIVKGKTITVVVNFTVSDSISEKVSEYVALNGTGYTVNSAVWDGSKITANITINSDATSTYVLVGLKVVNTTALAEAVTITVGTSYGNYIETETYEEAITRIGTASIDDTIAEYILTDMTTYNLFDKSKAITNGMYNVSGAFILNNYQYSTGLIPIEDYAYFAMNRDQGTVPTWTLWKSDGTTLVRGIQERGITINPETDTEAVYIRSSFLATEIDTLMIIPNEHPCMSEYFSYKKPRKAIKGEWVGKKLVTIGDSLTQMGYWQEMTAQMLGMSYEVSAQSGGNMTAIANFIDNIESADVMTVWAGTNDWYNSISLGTLLNNNKNTYYGAIQYVCEKLATNLPGCKLLLITPLQRNTTSTSEWAEDTRGFKINPTTGKTLEDYANAVIETAEIYGIPVLDMFHCGGVNKINIDSWTTDKLHPGKAQFERLAWKIIEKISNL